MIATSGGLTEGQAQAMRQDGFDAYLHKPFEIQQVVAAIEDTVAVAP